MLVSIVISCNKDKGFDCLKSTGKIIVEKRELKNYKNIELNDHFVVNLIQDTIEFVEVEAGKNIISEIKCVVINNKLKISDELTCNWARSYKNEKIINIHFINLDSIDVIGECDIISIDSIFTDTLFIDIKSGIATVDIKLRANGIYFRTIATGDFKLSGKVNFNYQYIFGTGYLHAENLSSKYIHIVSKTTGDCYINVKDHLFVEQIYSGNVFYKGSPYKIELKSDIFKDRLKNIN